MNCGPLFVPRHWSVDGKSSLTVSLVQGATVVNADEFSSVEFVLPATMARYMHCPLAPGTMMSPALYEVEATYARYSGALDPGAFSTCVTYAPYG